MGWFHVYLGLNFFILDGLLLLEFNDDSSSDLMMIGGHEVVGFAVGDVEFEGVTGAVVGAVAQSKCMKPCTCKLASARRSQVANRLFC